MANTELMVVEVVYATPAEQCLMTVQLELGATAQRAVECAGVLQRFPELLVSPLRLGIFSRRITPETVLRTGDRVEIYRPLLIDPKTQRRERAAQKR